MPKLKYKLTMRQIPDPDSIIPNIYESITKFDTAESLKKYLNTLDFEYVLYAGIEKLF